MSEWLIAHQGVLRPAVFAGVLTAMALWELRAQRRARGIGRAARWPGNLGLAVLGTLLLRLVLPAGAVGAALAAQERGWGLLHLLPLPDALAALLALVLLDLAIYAQHVATHAVPALWRLHRVHHADLDLDTTSGVRFHPLEIALSMLWKIAVVAALGAPPGAVIAFEVLLNASALFNHANVRLSERTDAALRRWIVTPDMHRVHHSVLPAETDSNYGFNLSCWDRWFGTYRAAPAAGHEAMQIGLAAFRDPRELRLDHLLWQPLRSSLQRQPSRQCRGRSRS
jgi:sterol desaturase/sphingolipid hydroxylase (fatty acid hydroxylase superfamily)